MNTIKINEQIAFLRKQKGMTQEELAQMLGVTNQAVSKWESAQSCPDIQLLPELAQLFGVSVDELLGYRPTESLADICLKIRSYFAGLPEKEAFDDAYRIAALLHEAAMTDGYKKKLQWKPGRDYADEKIGQWGFSACSEPEGCTIRKKNAVFLSAGKSQELPTASYIRELHQLLEQTSDTAVLKTMFALYQLTADDFETYASCADIARRARLKEEQAAAALENLPVEIREEDDEYLYRLEGAFLHVPQVLEMLCI